MEQYEAFQSDIGVINNLMIFLTFFPIFILWFPFLVKEIRILSFRGVARIVLILVIMVVGVFLITRVNGRVVSSWENSPELKQEIERNSRSLENFLSDRPVTRHEMWWVITDGKLADSGPLKYYEVVLTKYIVPEKELGRDYSFKDYCQKQVYPVLGAYESFKRSQ